MKLALSALFATGILFTCVSAFADETSEGVRTLPMITIYGKRPPLPSVVIDVTRPTAAHEAGQAHDEMRNAWLLKTEPSAMRNH